MASTSAKQQIIQNIKDATNILVTVSAEPTVDELSAALGLTLFLNELDKHATAVFSGPIPPAIDFLEPAGTFEGTVDSLRDFIISLDKEKADHLRYKVVDDAVKIFITPYRTTISEKDLNFSQGDYNVELVIALNVENGEHLDAALTAHGKILHDAVVSTVTVGDVKSTLGTIDWHGANVSGVSEMLVELIEELKTSQTPMGEATATALLTGIVDVTERFSNALTSSRVMTLAAQLMAAGANQQQIITRLAESQAKARQATEAAAETPDDAASKATGSKKNAKPADGSLTIRHEKTGSLDEVAQQALAEQQDEAARAAQSRLDRLNDIKAVPRNSQKQPSSSGPQTTSKPQTKPLIGGTLNATTERAERDKRRELDDDRNKTILSHSSHMDNEPQFGDKPLNAAMAGSDEPPKVDPLAKTNAGAASAADAKKVIKPLGSTPAGNATGASPVLPGMTDAAQPTDPVAHALQFEPLAAPAPRNAAAGAGKTLAELEVGTSHDTTSAPSALPMPDFSSLPPLPPAPAGLDIAELPPLPETPDKQFNPGAFQIPGKTD